MKILIADDDPVSRKIIERYIIEWGYDAITVSNGDEALGKLNESDCDINFAILDWVMPGLSGLDVCRQIRSQKNRDFIYLMMLTAKNSEEDFATGFDAGIDDYIVKPFQKSALFYRIQTAERIIGLESELQFLKRNIISEATILT
ncbi:MAG: response regulator [Candidatus Zixiibacteriota bacterium]